MWKLGLVGSISLAGKAVVTRSAIAEKFSEMQSAWRMEAVKHS